MKRAAKKEYPGAPSGKDYRVIVALLTVSLFFFCPAAGPSEGAGFREAESTGLKTDALVIDPSVSTLRVPPPQVSTRPVLLGAAINVTFTSTGKWGDHCIPWPSAARTAFLHAAGIWASLLNSQVPIEIEACWADNLPYGVLGHGGPTAFLVDFAGAPNPATWYPIALANAVNGSDLYPSGADIYAGFSSIFDWYYGTDGNPPANLVDFVTVVLHELGHGLGFLGSMDVDGSGVGSWGGVFYPPYPFVYDLFTENGLGQRLINTTLFPNPSLDLGSQLTGGNVYFAGAEAKAANGGAALNLHAPPVWVDGSSYSHLDDIFDGTQNALMTYSLAYGEAVHSPGPVTEGVLKDMGWPLCPGQVFGDVPCTFWNFDDINATYNQGITGGCSATPPLYCPADQVTREQMAAFIIRAIEGEPGGSCSAQTFGDVPVNSVFCKHIDRMVARGITGGCGGGNYCPQNVVTREQMAAFIVRAAEGEPAGACAAQPFNDVAISNPFCKHIERMAALGITGGCGGGNYCPQNALTRDQMASLLRRAFNY